MPDAAQLVTVVVPSHDRHDFLPRVADLYRGGPCPVRVVDSTAEPFAPADDLDGIEYVHRPGVSFAEKIVRALGEVGTPHVVLVGDDDFVVPGAVVDASAALAGDRSISTVQGRRFSFWCHRRDVEITAYPSGEERSLDGATALARVAALLSGANYRDLFYAVHRTDELLAALTDCRRLPHALYLQELLTGVHDMAAGTHLFVDRLFCLRQAMLTGGTYTEVSLGSLLYEDAHADEMASFFDLCAGYVTAADGGDGDTAAEVRTLLTGQINRLAGGERTWQRRGRGRRLLEGLGLFGPRLRHLRRRLRGLDRGRRLVLGYHDAPPPEGGRLALSEDDRAELATVLAVVARHPRTHLG